MINNLESLIKKVSESQKFDVSAFNEVSELLRKREAIGRNKATDRAVRQDKRRVVKDLPGKSDSRTVILSTK